MRADGAGNLFLVHRDGPNGRWGLAEFVLSVGRWGGRAYLTGDTSNVRPSSLVVRQTGELCIGNVATEGIVVTCGSMQSLTEDVFRPDEDVDPGSYISLVESSDALHVVYVDASRRLKLGTMDASRTWTFQEIYEGPSYGVSSAFDAVDNQLVLSYYTCEAVGCSLEVLSHPL